jgi:hypothetical protein
VFRGVHPHEGARPLVAELIGGTEQAVARTGMEEVTLALDVLDVLVLHEDEERSEPGSIDPVHG